MSARPGGGGWACTSGGGMLNVIYDSMVNPAQFTYYGKASGYAPVYAVCASDPTISMVMCPIKPTEEVEALCKKMFSE